jgi:hypothetical protein
MVLSLAANAWSAGDPATALRRLGRWFFRWQPQPSRRRGRDRPPSGERVAAIIGPAL